MDARIIQREDALRASVRGMTAPNLKSEGSYASPSVSNIAALIASAAVLPAQTTNCIAG